jgi:hypothetical protein
MVLRGDEPLGNVEYEFAIHDNGHVIGGIVDVAPADTHPRAPRVSARLLPQSAVEPDLHLSLGDGTAVAFFVEHPDGFIANGRRYIEPDGTARATPRA